MLFDIKKSFWIYIPVDHVTNFCMTNIDENYSSDGMFFERHKGSLDFLKKHREMLLHDTGCFLIYRDKQVGSKKYYTIDEIDLFSVSVYDESEIVRRNFKDTNF